MEEFLIELKQLLNKHEVTLESVFIDNIIPCSRVAITGKYNLEFHTSRVDSEEVKEYLKGLKKINYFNKEE